MIDMSHRLMEMLDAPQILLPELTGAPVIYGSGGIGRKVCQMLKARGITPSAFIDRRACGGEDVEGIPVYPPDTVFTDKNCTVIIGVFNREKDAYSPKILAFLKELGYNSVMDFETFFQEYQVGLPESIFWLTKPDFYLNHRTEIEAVCGMWADSRSHEIYVAQILHRLGHKSTILPQPDWGDMQYDPEDVPLLSAPYNFIDIGAYDGDTLELLRRRNKILNKVVCFEPDMQSFRKLTERVSQHGPFARETYLVPAGVGEQCMTLSFTADGTEAASISTAGAVSIPVVAVDFVLQGVEPNYIKLDVEGYEESALKGLRRTVEKYHPMLAVSVYHRPQDLFLLPQMLREWNWHVDLYLRMHGSHCFDTVLYAIPKEN